MPRFNAWIKNTVTKVTTLAANDLIPLVSDDPNVTKAVNRGNMAGSLAGDMAANAAFSSLYAPSVLDEDDFATNSATRPPSQQSVREFTEASFVRLGAFIRPVVSLPLPMWPGSSEASGTGTLNQMVAFPVIVPWSVSVDQLGINITTNESGATPRLGLYLPNASGRPGALLVDGGTVDASTTGVKSVTFGSPVNITSGLVYFTVAWQGAASALRFTRYAQPSGNTYIRVPGSDGATGGVWGYSVNSVSGALPDPFTSVSYALSNASVPMMNIRCASIL